MLASSWVLAAGLVLLYAGFLFAWLGRNAGMPIQGGAGAFLVVGGVSTDNVPVIAVGILCLVHLALWILL